MKGYMMKKLTIKNRILVGLTLFSMFFGAGNLIFPPFLGAMAGRNTWVAMAGFAMTAVGFPILGVAAVAEAGGLTALGSRVHPRFAFVFTLLIYLSIGPCLAIPRTASTSFEMAVKPFVNAGAGAQLLYSLVFFGIAFLVALKPDRLTQRLGKVLTPCLLLLIVILFAGCLIHPTGDYGAPAGQYASRAFSKGFLDGYQTMDTIAALNFGLIIALNIKALGVKQDSGVVKETIKAGAIAGVIMLLVYAALAHIGAMAGQGLGRMENGAGTLTALAQYLFGNTGMILLGVIFFIACLNTCIGLLSCCSNYFCTILPRPGYVGWVAIFAIASMIVSNAGLNKILEISVPVLNAIYPVAIVLIVLALIHRAIRRFPYVYQCTVLLVGLTSVLSSLTESGLQIPVLSPFIQALPFFAVGLEWLIPAVAGVAAGILLSVTAGEGQV